MFDLFNKAKRANLCAANHAALEEHALLTKLINEKKIAFENASDVRTRATLGKELLDLEIKQGNATLEAVTTASEVHRIDACNKFKVTALVGGAIYGAYKLYNHFCD